MVSIIIPTFNRAIYLYENLSRLSSNVNVKGIYEFIVIDNGSKDNTAEIVKNFAKSNCTVNLKYVYDDEPGLLTGRHRGYQESSGSILAFIDDDILVSETWLFFLNDLQSEYLDYDFFTGPCLPMYGAYPPEWLEYFWKTNDLGKECSWLSLMDFGQESKRIPLVYIWGLNFIVRRKALIKSGGFHPDNITSKFQHFQGDGETGLAKKAQNLGMKALYSPKLLVYHQIGSERMSKEYFGKRAYYQGVCNSFSSLRNKLCYEDNFTHTNQTVGVFYRSWKGKLIYKLPFSKTIIKWLKEQYKKQNFKSAKKLPPDYLNILNYTKEQYKLGYEFHQSSFHSQQVVRDWVIREHYWDYKLPK